jgi:hypothetical protein
MQQEASQVVIHRLAAARFWMGRGKIRRLM